MLPLWELSEIVFTCVANVQFIHRRCSINICCVWIKIKLDRSHAGYHSSLRSHVCLGSSCLWQFVRLSLFLMTLTVLKSPGQVFCRLSLNWDFLIFISWLDCGYGFLGGRPQSKALLSSQYIKSTYNEYDVPLLMLWSPDLNPSDLIILTANALKLRLFFLFYC